MTRTIKFLIWTICICAVMAVLTGKNGGAPLFVSVGMIALAFVAILVIFDIFKSS